MSAEATILEHTADYILTKKFSFNPFGGGKKKVLVVEDNANDIIMIELALKACKRDYIVARNAEAAEALVMRNGFSLAFIDLRLPTMSGQTFIKLIRDRSPHTHVVVTCGEVSDLTLLEPSAVISLIIKPVTEKKVRELLEKVRG